MSKSSRLVPIPVAAATPWWRRPLPASVRGRPLDGPESAYTTRGFGHAASRVVSTILQYAASSSGYGERAICTMIQVSCRRRRAVETSRDDGRVPEFGGTTTMDRGTETARVTRRGDDTRERLLDAVETLIADHGFQTLTHRLIAQRADVHVALLNYHFGSKEQLIEDAIARRAGRLMQAQSEALEAVQRTGVWTVEDVLWAFWQPFAVLDASTDPAWRNFLCVVARLASYERGDEIFSRHFGPLEQACLEALRRALPAPTDEELARGFRHCRLLFERELMTRCNDCAPDATSQRRRSERLIAFLAGGLRALNTEVARTTA
jgi:AcrR family transcriptional regulator